MRLYVITPDWEVKDEIALVRELFHQGLKRLHLRKPDYTKADFKAYLREIPAKYRKRIIIHSLDNRDLIKQFGLKGLHINSDERSGPNRDSLKVSFLKLMNPNIEITTTYRTSRNLKKATNLYDYLILNNVFKSRSSKSYKQYHDWTQLENFLYKESQKILARGGVTKEKLPEINNLGFAGATVMEYIWTSEDPVRAFMDLKERIDYLKARPKQGSY